MCKDCNINIPSPFKPQIIHDGRRTWRGIAKYMPHVKRVEHSPRLLAQPLKFVEIARDRLRAQRTGFHWGIKLRPSNPPTIVDLFGARLHYYGRRPLLVPRARVRRNSVRSVTLCSREACACLSRMCSAEWQLVRRARRRAAPEAMGLPWRRSPMFGHGSHPFPSAALHTARLYTPHVNLLVLTCCWHVAFCSS